MTWIDALTVTALGMAVVFSGLILTALLITTFGLLARAEERRTEAAADPTPVKRTDQPPVDGAVLAVISAVLEVERRLHQAESTGRLTIVRSAEPRRSP